MTAGLREDTVAINLALLKRFRFYQPFDPDGLKFFGWHAHRLAWTAFIAVAQAIMAYAIVGFLTNLNTARLDAAFVLLMSTYLESYVCLTKMAILLLNADKVWDLFDVARLDFLRSRGCRENGRILREGRDRSIKLTNAYFLFTTAVMAEWVSSPWMLNAFLGEAGRQHRRHNIWDYRYPVSTAAYNAHYTIFYTMELMIGAFMLFGTLMADMILMSICWVIAAQYEVITQAFKELGHGRDSVPEEDEEHFKSILFDQQQVFLKVQSFNSVVGKIVILFVGINSGIIITQSFTFIFLISTSVGSSSIITIIKLGCTILYVSSQLYIYCYLFDEMNLKRNAVNFGMYSCNWTKMNLKFRKLLLLAMRMNDANQMTIKASPRKIVDLQLFANVMSMSYNIVSVLLKSMNKRTT